MRSAALAVSLAALLLPSLFARGFHQRPGVAAFLDGLVVTAIAGLVAFDILPAAMATAGVGTLVAFAIGLALPTLAERLGLGGHAVHGVSLMVGQALLLLHSAFDGIALATGTLSDFTLVVAVVLHQVPVGLAIWVSTETRFGARAAWASLSVMAATTVAGFYAGERALALADPPMLALFEGLAAGTLLHVVAHAGPRGPARQAGAGALAAAGAVLLLHVGGAAESAAAAQFAALWTLGAPALLAGGLLARVGGRWLDIPAFFLSFALLGPMLALARAALDAARRGPRVPLAPDFTAGVVVAALVALAPVDGHAWPIVAAVAGALVPLGSAGIVPIAAVLLVRASPGAAWALVVASAGVRWGRRARIGLTVGAGALGLGIDAAGISGGAWLGRVAEVLPVPVQVICGAALAAMFSASLLRDGPRGWLAGFGGGHDHEHR